MVRDVAIGVVAFLSLTCTNAQGLDRPKTGDLVIISGTRTVIRWRARDRVDSGHGWLFTDHEYVSLTPREGTTLPLEIKAWVRGIPEIDLISADEFQKDPSPCPRHAPSAVLKLSITRETQFVYRYCVAVDSFSKASGELLIAAADADVEHLPLAFERDADMFVSSWANALFSPALTAGAGVVLATAFGFLSFLVQQRYLRRSEQARAFETKKIARAKNLSNFFTNEYDDQLKAIEGTDDRARAHALRMLLRQADIYTILPVEAIRSGDRLCDRRIVFSRKRLAGLDRLIRKNFAEFVRKG